MTDLAAKLPQILPRAIVWAEAQSRNICLLRGDPVDAKVRALARAVGVKRPDRIRVWIVPVIPGPDDAELQQLALEYNLIGPGTHGLTLGYGIFILQGFFGPQVLSHEFRHVHQIETVGSIAEFLPLYLEQIAAFGYYDAPYEIDARGHELLEWPDR
jgi:hypothetical protein